MGSANHYCYQTKDVINGKLKTIQIIFQSLVEPRTPLPGLLYWFLGFQNVVGWEEISCEKSVPKESLLSQVRKLSLGTT